MVVINGVALVSLPTVATVLLALFATQGFIPLPPDLPFPSIQTRVPEDLNRGAILQLWGHAGDLGDPLPVSAEPLGDPQPGD